MKIFGKDVNVKVNEKALLGIATAALAIGSALVNSKTEKNSRLELKEEVTKEVLAKLHSEQS